MRFVIQRALEGAVTIEGKTVGQIGRGLVVLIGVAPTDDQKTAEKMVRKLLAMRIFEDSHGKTNLSLDQVGGGLLLISQFTLYADCRRGNRPGFTGAAGPDLAESLYDWIVAACREKVPQVATGVFGADMKVSLVNDGPFTIILDSDSLG